jgi:hypothetical protein
MGLLERYLHAVRGYLPAATQDDIVAELGDDLRARFEERAAALGRPLTEDEEAELLRPYGPRWPWGSPCTWRSWSRSRPRDVRSDGRQKRSGDSPQGRRWRSSVG